MNNSTTNTILDDDALGELCVERVWDNGDMTDCGLPGVTVIDGRPYCAKHIPKQKPSKRALAKEVSWNPTTEEAEKYLRAYGIDPKDVVNSFIEQLLSERSQLQSQLEQVTKERDEARSGMMRICTHPNTYPLRTATRRCHDCGLEIPL